MRKLLASGALVCVLAFAVSAGDSHTPGAEPTPTPSPCPETEVCDEGGSGAVIVSDGSTVAALIDGALFIFNLLP